MADLLPGVPRIESPLFGTGAMQDSLRPDERELAARLHEHGFATIDFPDPLIDERIERIKCSLAPHLGMTSGVLAAPPPGSARRLQDAWKFDADVRAIAANETIRSLLSRLYGREAFPFQTLNFPVGTQQAVHSDSVHFSSLPERWMCGVWLAMEDVTPENGPLFYVPGSHRWPIVTNGLVGRRGFGNPLASAQDPYGPAWQALIAANGKSEEPFLARKGQALIWCANLLHGGAPVIDQQRTRWSQVTHYFFDDCIYYTPAFSDEAIGRLDLRHINSIIDGSEVPNRYLGHTVGAPRGGLGIKNQHGHEKKFRYVANSWAKRCRQRVRTAMTLFSNLKKLNNVLSVTPLSKGGREVDATFNK